MSQEFDAPVVATVGSTDPAAPLVVLLHGRGSNERDIIGLADHLPTGPAYASVRAPIAEGGGYAWFANRGILRPVAASLADLVEESGTAINARRDPGGHGLPVDTVVELGGWIAARAEGAALRGSPA